ncbi:MAG: DUF1343 domain-containing protein [Acidobacteriaceae bacterium]|nr:DUF1343 domain-containing protein [Acidobacteriaceae bacterium]
MRLAGILLLAGGLAAAYAKGAQTPAAENSFPQVDSILEDAVRTGYIPGAVVAIGHNGQLVYRKAYGYRVLIPQREPMTEDTIFDAASLTKVIATTPSVMRLFEQGKLRIDDPVTKYLPEFQGGHSDITIRLLMTHFSGLPPDVDLEPRWTGYETGIQKALTATPIAPPGGRFIYSDINFLLMGEIVRRLSGETLAQFAREQIFEPLGMKETGYLPAPALRSRIAATEIDPDTGQPLRGVVHDPTARYMGGIAGHAGVFTTAADLALYAEMLLGNGRLGAVQLFDPLTVRKFTTPGSPADQPILRGLGWDIDSPYSSNRGELYPIGSFGHTGFTGTSMWIDPVTNSFVIVLTNVVHPKRGKSLSSLRSRIATAVAARFGEFVPDTVALTGYNETIAGAGVHRVVNRQVKTMTGLDVLEQDGFAELKGKRIGLITNHTGLDRNGRRNIDVMLQAHVNLVKLFSPEHGLTGNKDTDVAYSTDPATGLPVVSLSEPSRRRLTAAQMEGLDAVVYDIQDVGARFYTYSCTLLYALEEAAKAHKPFYVLDRPNPITGTHVEGPEMESDLHSLVGCYDMPLRHGMTDGELATMANAEQHWNAPLHVVKLKNWERGDWFDATTLAWIDPSPNMRSLNAALLYPGLAMLEFDPNYSVGRGTDSPFEQIGADWIRGQDLAMYLNGQFIPGVRVYATRFQPTSSNFAGKQIEGVRFVVTDREAFDSTRLGIELAVALEKLFPGKIDLAKCRFLIGNREVVQDLALGMGASAIWAKVRSQASEFEQRRKAYLLY